MFAFHFSNNFFNLFSNSNLSLSTILRDFKKNKITIKSFHDFFYNTVENNQSFPLKFFYPSYPKKNYIVQNKFIITTVSFSALVNMIINT